MSKTLAEVRKALIALLGFAGAVVANGLIQGTALKWTNIAISFGTLALVYAVPNDDPKKVAAVHEPVIPPMPTSGI